MFSGSSDASAADGPIPWFGVARDGPGRLRLRGELDLAAAPELQASLSVAEGEAEGDIEVDCRALTFIDAAGLRVLLAAHRSRAVRGAKLVVVNPSPCVIRLLELTGCDGTFAVRRERTVP